jgi:hypothetical protein
VSYDVYVIDNPSSSEIPEIHAVIRFLRTTNMSAAEILRELCTRVAAKM